MYKISAHIELPIAHTLDSAYSGLCCGNVYRDKKNDGEQDRYTLRDEYGFSNGVLPVLHGHNYIITVAILTRGTGESNMIIDFKKMKKTIHNYFDQYDHSMILTEKNPLVDVYRENYKEHGIDFKRSRLFVWPENPTAEYMARYWAGELKHLFLKSDHEWSTQNGKTDLEVEVTVEETANNKVVYCTGDSN